MKLFRQMSLAHRLGLFLAVLAVVVFGVSGLHLYQTLSTQLQKRDDSTLLGVVDQLRHYLEEFRAVEALRADPHLLFDVVHGHKGMVFAIRDEAGALLLASPGGDVLAKDDSAFTPDSQLQGAVVRDWTLRDGEAGRKISVWTRVGHAPGSRVLLAVARKDSRETRADLRSHLEDLIWTILIGAFITALLSFLIVQHGLRPLREIAKAAGEITAQRLGGRLTVDDAPLELRQMVHAFNLMLDRLEDSFRRLSQFSSDLAHDLRTPISNLMVETQVTLGQRRTVNEYEELLISNVEEYERLTRMVENMLFLANADNASVMLRKECLSGETELKRIAEYFEGMAEEAGIKIHVEASGNLLVDAILFRRAVSNLVANAIRYTTKGATMTIRGYDGGDGEFVVEVVNPGVGIPPEHLSRIFDRFYRVDVSRVGSHASSGLGLAIVKSIVELHGGNVQVESTPNGLTTFRLVFH